MTEALLKTPLHSWHAEHGGRLVDFAGWSMPVQYSTIVEEHEATRKRHALFDISHMGRLRFVGADAERFLDWILTRRVLGLKPSAVRYALVTNADGGILDDVLVYHLTESDGSSRWQLVVNAGNRMKIVQWLGEHRGRFQVEVLDETLETAMIAVQGPRALEAVQPLVAGDLRLDELKYYSGVVTKLDGMDAVLSRTGYTGEDGCELMVARDVAARLWQTLIDGGATPAGLGARDTLRLEAAMPLYGHELDETIDPFQAGLGFAVQLGDHRFVGSEALADRKAQPTPWVRVGLRLDGKRAARDGYPVLAAGTPVGRVTSGTFSPTLGYPIAMAYVQSSHAATDQPLEVDIRGRREPARIVTLPFYTRSS